MSNGPTRRESDAGPAGTNPDRVGLEQSSPTPALPVADRPDRRGRQRSLVAGTYALFAAGIVLFAAVIISPGTAGTNAATVVSAALVVVLGAALLAELLEPRPIAAIGLVGGAALGISALLPEAIEGPEVGRLVAGALLFLGSAAILAGTMPRRDRGGEP